METIVISLGGSVLLADDVNEKYFDQLKQLLFSYDNTKIFVVVGGGPPARKYISMARLLGVPEELLDTLGIAVTRVNALFLVSILLGNECKVPSSFEEAVLSDQSLVVMGGTTPGHSTDFVGAQLASITKADIFVIATNVDGVYDKDPRANNDAVMYSSISAEDLLKTYGSSWKSAGSNMVIDGPALQKIHSEKIPTVVINGGNIDILRRVIDHQPFHGTIITI
ncbi:MAG: UMP kinase [Candidatus Thermoplasmatota archaeon]|nr:UMP kinase [Candidatus Thermoplasmatota archaeon]